MIYLLTKGNQNCNPKHYRAWFMSRTLMAFPFNNRKIPTDISKNKAPRTARPDYA